MSPRQFGKVDVSATWQPCPRCPHRHPSHAPCPPTAVWLVLVMCHRCDPKTGVYCGRHAGRIQAVPEPADAIPAPPGSDGEYRRRIGEEGAA